MKLRENYGLANIVGQRIVVLRKSQNLTQKQFINKLHNFGLKINSASYSKLEGQTRIATDKEIYAIAKILKIDINDLFE